VMSFQPWLLSALSTAAHLGKRLVRYPTTAPRSRYLAHAGLTGQLDTL
jgi:hypothetical protein